MERSSYVRKLCFNDVGFWFVIVRYFALLNNYVTLGLQKHEFLIKSDYVIFSYVQVTYENYVTIMLGRGLSIYCIFSYVRIVLQMLYLKWHIFHDVRITFFCGTFALRMERMLKLRFVFVHHRDVFFHYITISLFICSMYLRLFTMLELRYILVRSNYVRKLRFKMVIF